MEKLVSAKQKNNLFSGINESKVITNQFINYLVEEDKYSKEMNDVFLKRMKNKEEKILELEKYCNQFKNDITKKEYKCISKQKNEIRDDIDATAKEYYNRLSFSKTEQDKFAKIMVAAGLSLALFGATVNIINGLSQIIKK